MPATAAMPASRVTRSSPSSSRIDGPSTTPSVSSTNTPPVVSSYRVTGYGVPVWTPRGGPPSSEVRPDFPSAVAQIQGRCPARALSSTPAHGSSRMKVQVANRSAPRDSSRSLVRARTSPGSLVTEASARSPARTCPMKAAASMLWPWTSPMDRPMRPSPSVKASYQSPPTLRPWHAGAYRTARCSRRATGRSRGSMSLCSARASSTRERCISACARAWAVRSPSLVSSSSPSSVVPVRDIDHSGEGGHGR